MQTLTLDYSTWRSGGSALLSGERPTVNNILGIGDTKLLNEQGFMCCLGQFSLQLDKNLVKKDLLQRILPSDLEMIIPEFTFTDNSCYQNRPLARAAININDNPITTPLKKIEELKELFGEHGFEINVINQPEPTI